MNKKQYTKEELARHLKKAKKQLGKMPTAEGYESLSSDFPDRTTISRYFGSWHNALKEVFNYTTKTMNPPQQVQCKQCDKKFMRQPGQIKQSKSGNQFCSSSCAATYNNTHKTTGTRRSKLEKYLEEQLVILYPKLEIHFNRKDTINSELDIYIPSLKLAFELNGIFHYEPIHGQKKLAQIQNNDHRKFQACSEKNIGLCIIDSSKLKYFKPKNAQKYLDIIIKIINAQSGI